ncbi:hypothetical protein BQ8794_330084 [Mesorhizobium prunaredense]|uniref:6-phosphogluconate dehydrogenase C-terminal domain-containing protein n=1 Tax=Mesorhizobium prunaredense TaxID=1631249 RepID=A0A1R3VBV8_9HYPH|nr:hypothetical protein BQ8794_330084 [Mesorhizobium prunaredense]
MSVIEAQQLGIPATAIEAAVAARVLSSIKDERLAAEKAYGNGGVTGDKDALLEDLELALFERVRPILLTRSCDMGCDLRLRRNP